jgi:DNA-binding transcriptional LysR family regulator
VLASSFHVMLYIPIMRRAHDGRNVDLNLLRVLGALLAERHLTRAGARLGMTQSATSHALARLRRVFDDPLFIRTARGLAPTARAEALADPIDEVLRGVERCLRVEPPFHPEAAARTFQLATSDYGSFVIGAKLLAFLERDAPNIDVRIRALDGGFPEQLARGEADVVVSPARAEELPVGIRSRPLFRERFVCLVRAGHPSLRRAVDLAAWLSMRHLLVAPRGTPGGVVDETLAQLGQRRRVALAVPHFLLAPHAVASSDLVVTLGARVAGAFAHILPVRAFEPPVRLPGFEVRMYWHERHHRDQAQRWFRDVLRAAATP